MQVQGVTAVTPALSGAAASSPATGFDFGRALGDLIEQFAATEQRTTDLVARAATAEDVDIHDVMIAVQAESLLFQVGLQVRNKLVEAYHEVFRMQV
ncbi:MAG: flagellar hook-basal body complex protein FliE [Chloroflexota bacterium]